MATGLGATGAMAYGLSDSTVVGDAAKAGLQYVSPTLANYLGIGTTAASNVGNGALGTYGGLSSALATETGTGLGTTLGGTGRLVPYLATETGSGLGAAGTGGLLSEGEGAGLLATSNPIMLPAAAGLAAPKLVDAIHKDSMENLGHNLTFGLVNDEGTAKAVGSTATGALAGALAGAAATSWSGPGALVGAAVGGIGGLLSSACIIITACTDAHSPEVEIAREYRDKFLNKEQLRGYYKLAEKIVPRIETNSRVKNFIKKYLVLPLIEYGSYKLGKTENAGLKARLISICFLGLIQFIGMTCKSYTRQNGEVY